MLLVGADGAGSAIAIALLAAGVSELVVHDADASRAAALLELLAVPGGGRVIAGAADPAGCDLVFNATPMGMEAGDPLPVDAALLTSSMFVCPQVARRSAWVRALAKAIQMARERLRRSPECGGLIVVGVMEALWVALMSPGPRGSCGQPGISVPSLV